jgi:hypothetical protein
MNTYIRIIPLLPLNIFLQETVAFIFSTCTRVEKLTPHLDSLVFVALRSRLRVLVTQAQRVVNISSSRALRASVQTLLLFIQLPV